MKKLNYLKYGDLSYGENTYESTDITTINIQHIVEMKKVYECVEDEYKDKDEPDSKLSMGDIC